MATIPAEPGMAHRRKSVMADISSCSICNKGATETCRSCNAKVCLSCIGTKDCTACELVSNLQQGKRDNMQQATSVFAKFFKTRKIRPNEFAKTPERGNSGSDPSFSGGKGFLGFLRRGSLSSSSLSRNLTPYLDEEAKHASPMNERPPRSAPRSASAIGDSSSADVYKRLNSELENLRKLNEQLKQDNLTIRSQLEKSANSSSPTEGVPSSQELEEAKARAVDFQVQVQEARDEIFRLGAELITAQEREKQLEEYVNNILAQQQQRPQAQGGAAVASTDGSSAGGPRGRSAIPPCVPLPNTEESLIWLESIRNGTYEDYWLTPAAQIAEVPSFGTLPPPPLSAASISTVDSSGKKRSEIPTPPPLPAGMVAAAPALNLMGAGGLHGRRGSAPGKLETLVHQKKRESVFARVNSSSKPELKALFWNVMDHNKVQGTIFENLNGEKPLVKPEAIQAHIKDLATRFAKRPTRGGESRPTASAAVAAAPVQAPRLNIMDPKRKQQIGILLSGSFRNVSLLELKKAIIALDTNILTIERVKVLLEMIPTQEEITQLEGFGASGLLDSAFFAGMSKEETFFTDMSNIPRLKQRLLCLSLESTFGFNAAQLLENLDVFAEAIRITRESQSWKAFIALCLETGNYLNNGNNGLGGAWGFSLKEGLKKFSEMKSCENNSRFSLMHWIAEVAAAHKPELLDMSEEFGIVEEASGKSVEELKTEVNGIKRQIDMVKGEIEKCKLESSDGAAKFLTRMVPFVENILEPQYNKVLAKVEQIEKEANALVVMHGESLQTTTCQQLFKIIIHEGIGAFLKCHDENLAKKLDEQKQIQQQQSAIRRGTVDEGKAVPGGNMKRDRSQRDTVNENARLELEAAMARRRRQPQ